MASYLRPRRGTASAASAVVLKKGEIFCEFKNNPATTSGGTSCGAIKMGNGTTSYQYLGYFLNPDTDVVTWAATTAEGLPGDWSSYGGKSATSAAQGNDMYDDLNALITGSQNKKVLPLIKNLLFKLATQVTTLNNEYDVHSDDINTLKDNLGPLFRYMGYRTCGAGGSEDIYFQYTDGFVEGVYIFVQGHIYSGNGLWMITYRGSSYGFSISTILNPSASGSHITISAKNSTVLTISTGVSANAAITMYKVGITY